jgi:hypothetical protein
MYASWIFEESRNDWHNNGIQEIVRNMNRSLFL